MRDIAVLAFLFGCIGATIWRPWLGVLCLAIFSYLNPHTFAWGFVTSFPVYQVMFIAAFLAMLTSKERQPIPKDWRIYFFYMLWFYFLLTTLNAIVPAAAWVKMIEVSKIYLPFILTLVLINTRKKLYFLIITISFSIGLVAVKGGIWQLGRDSATVYTGHLEHNSMKITHLRLPY